MIYNGKGKLPWKKIRVKRSYIKREGKGRAVTMDERIGKG